MSLPTNAAASASTEFDVIRGDYQVRWYGDVLSRSSALPVPATVGCAAAPDASPGSACAFVANIRIGGHRPARQR